MTTAKFDHSALTEGLYELSLAGGDDECGDVTEVGFYAVLFRGIKADDLAVQYRNELTETEADKLVGAVGAVVWNDNDGHVYADLYYDRAELEARWRVIQRVANPEDKGNADTVRLTSPD